MNTFRFLLLTTFILLSVSAIADQHRVDQHRVVSVTPVTHLISKALLDNTGVTVDLLSPSRLPINRVPAWLRRVDASELTAADAVLTIESVWPSLELYPTMRSLNIRTVPIDIASELSPGGARVLMRPGIALESEFFWLDLNNLIMMLNIAARDLVRLWPEYADQIDSNRLLAHRAIQHTQIQIDEYLADKPINSISLNDDRLMPLALSLSLPILSTSEGNAHLYLTMDNVEAEFAIWHAIWQIETLHRLSAHSLGEWLESLESSLRDALVL